MGKEIFVFFIFLVISTLSFSVIAQEERPIGTFYMSEGMGSDVIFEKWNSETEEFSFQRKGESFSFSLSAFLCWGAPAELSLTDSTLVLTDGSLWLGGNPKMKTELKSESIDWETLSLGTRNFSLDEVAGILFPGVPILTQERFLTELRETHFEEDVLVFKTGERISGEFLTLDEESVTFRTRELSPKSQTTLLNEPRNLQIATNQLAGLFFSDALHIKSMPLNNSRKFFWLGLADGSLIRFQLGENQLDFQKISPEQIVYVELPQTSQKFFNQSLTSATEKIEEKKWLDDIKPTAVKNGKISGQSGEPGVKSIWKARAEPDGGRLRLGKTIFRRGISVQAGTAIHWTLDGNFHQLGVLPALAASTSVRPLKKVRCRIITDGKVAAEQILEMGSEAKLLLVELNQVKELVLETFPISETDVPMPDEIVVNWLNAFLVP